jgi:phosphoglycolate phosphatase
MELLSYKHIIWDFNGTLLDDVDLVVRIMNKLLEKRALPNISRHKYLEVFDFPVIEYYITLGFDFSKESYDDVAREFIYEYYMDGYVAALQPGADRILKLLGKSSITQSVLSASKTGYLKEHLEVLGIIEYFSLLNGLDDIKGAKKTDKGKEHITALGMDPEEILYIGDTLHDLEVADSIGCDHLLVSNGHQSRSRLMKASENVVDSLLDLLANGL